MRLPKLLIEYWGSNQLGIFSLNIKINYWHLEFLLFFQPLLRLGILLNSLNDALWERVLEALYNE